MDEDYCEELIEFMDGAGGYREWFSANVEASADMGGVTSASGPRGLNPPPPPPPPPPGG